MKVFISLLLCRRGALFLHRTQYKRGFGSGQPNIEHFHDTRSLRLWRGSLPGSSSVGLVPTMGALHRGHIHLARQAALENSNVVISIYVNPTQFGTNEDYGTYPKSLESDLASLANLNLELAASGNPRMGRVSCVFIPSTRDMFPTLPPSSELTGNGSFVTITPLGARLEGVSRPVFFRGVATICMKLFNAVQPHSVYFGQKDFQQAAVVSRMIKDFLMPIKFCLAKTIRESDGLAMSSRNVYLGTRRRSVAVALRNALVAGSNAYEAGSNQRGEIFGSAMQLLQQLLLEQNQQPETKRAQFEIGYISLADLETLEEVQDVDPSRGAVLSGAILMQPLTSYLPNESLGITGDANVVRLIDNIILSPKDISWP